MNLDHFPLEMFLRINSRRYSKKKTPERNVYTRYSKQRTMRHILNIKHVRAQNF